MISKPIIETIKTAVHSIIPDARIILFGSMARGTADKGSDYDLLVISPGNIPKKEKMDWRSKIDTALYDVLHAPVDVLLNSEEEVERKKELLGHIVRWAVKEGVEL
jgi:predicted nucleotidyltransferase